MKNTSMPLALFTLQYTSVKAIIPPPSCKYYNNFSDPFFCGINKILFIIIQIHMPKKITETFSWHCLCHIQPPTSKILISFPAVSLKKLPTHYKLATNSLVYVMG